MTFSFKKLIGFLSINFWLDLLFPVYCLGCQQERQKKDKNKPGQGFVCAHCFSTLRFNGLVNIKPPLNQVKNMDLALAAGNYDDFLLAEIIKTMKFKTIAALGEILADWLIIYWQGQDLLLSQKLIIKNNQGNQAIKPQILVVPIPISKKRRRQRGFNQAEIIAQHFSTAFNYNLTTKLIKIKNTPAQFKLSAKKRLNNLNNVFSWQGENLTDKTIILIDDVITTGATMCEAGKTLRLAGAKKIIALAVASG